MRRGALAAGTTAIAACAAAQPAPVAAKPAPESTSAPDLLAMPGARLDDGCVFDALWRAYGARFIRNDGRVVDGDRTTSEGQAYALVHALVAGDTAQFHRVLGWTRAHLHPDGAALPAWLWSGGVRDANSASDADLWMAWALLEAGRIWREPALETRGMQLLAAAAQREVADLPGLGKTLLPGPAGFHKDGVARLNPSYLVIPQLRRFALADPRGPWSEVTETAARVLTESAPHGIAPDWMAWRDGPLRDPVKGAAASWDAIRVPLWAGMIFDGDPLRAGVQRAAGGYLKLLSMSTLPESVDAVTGKASPVDAPAASTVALLPLAKSTGDGSAVTLIRARLRSAMTREGLIGDPPRYYDQNLVLFAVAWDEGRLRFDADGRLAPREATCAR